VGPTDGVGVEDLTGARLIRDDSAPAWALGGGPCADLYHVTGRHRRSLCGGNDTYLRTSTTPDLALVIVTHLLFYSFHMQKRYEVVAHGNHLIPNKVLREGDTTVVDQVGLIELEGI
jgi:hypothetical protein